MRSTTIARVWATVADGRFAAFIIALGGLLLASGPVRAEDIPAPTQKVGNHSTIATPDGGIRDDDLIDYICDQIRANGGQVKDVKLMVNSCYGGGLLDDLERAFGPGGECAGIPWVAGSASGPEQTARGWSDATLAANPDQNLGSTWTDGLVGKAGGLNVDGKAGSIFNGSSTNNVLSDLRRARNRDGAGPNGLMLESPEVATGNGGDAIMWTMAGAKHEAVIFGGLQTNPRHHNNIANVKAALEATWAGSPHTIQAIDGGTRVELLDAIAVAAERLDADTQLLIYLDDHGGSRFDFDEAIGGIAGVLIEDPVIFELEIPDGWFKGLFGNYFGVPSEFPEPFLHLEIDQCDGCSSWQYNFNGNPLPFPAGNPTGQVLVPVPFFDIHPGENLLEIFPQGSNNTQSGGSKTKTHNGGLRVSLMELATGPVNELLADQVLKPGQSAAYFDANRDGEGIFVELLPNGTAVVYMFSYDVASSSQAWMLGVGQQIGDGVVVNPLLRPAGAVFGPGFDPDDVVFEDFGALAFQFPACGNQGLEGGLFILPDLSTGFEEMLNFNYSQLYNIVSCAAAGNGDPNAGRSGSYFDPTHNGEGIILQVADNGTVVVQWFTYNAQGEQMWIQGTGAFDGDTLQVNNLFTTSGTFWGPDFDPDKVQRMPWGSLTMTFTGCGTASLNYISTAGFGTGQLDMERLTNLMGIPCQE